MSEEKNKDTGCNCHEDTCGCGGHDEDHECDCGGHHDHEEGLFVTLEDENGNEIQCEVVEGFVFEENEFALVQNPDDGSMYLFKVVGDDEDGELVVPEEDEFNRAIAYYESLLGSDE